MNDKVHTIVGVLPPIPQHPRTNDLFMPTSACPFRAAGERNALANHRAFGNLSVFARLSDTGSVEQVSADASAIAQGWAQAYPERYQAARTGFQASAERLDDQITREARPILFALAAVTALVLLIACANVANLSVARAIGRERELALRTALGAGRTQLAGQLLAESTLVALAGGALGLLIAWPAAGLLATFASRFTPRVVDASIDGAVLLFTLGASMLTGLACGVLPALVSRRRMTASLRDGGAQAGYSPKRARMGAALVVAQVAVCVSLVVAAGLFVGSLHRLSTVDVGYQDPDHLLTAQLSGNFSRQQQWSAADFIRFHADVLDRVRQLPGVVSAAITNAAPFTGVPGATPFAVDGRGDDAALRPVTDQNVASEDYFAAMGIPLVAGRTFDWSDTPASARVAVINQSMARQWDDRSPLGLTFRTFGGNAASPSSGTAYTVVGIVADARQYSLEQAPVAQFFTPLTQTQGFGAQIVIRTDQDPHQLVRPLKDIVSTLDSAIPVSDVATAAELRAERLRSPRLSTMLLVAFALLALAITLAGIAAVIATSVSQRTREFGVRMALGASRASVLAMVMRQGAWLLIIGLALGTVGAFAFSQVIARYLFAIEHADPFVYTGVAALILLTGLLACLGPARRATAVDPLSALRSD
jgi:putative ABC transport system permease protein